MWPVRQKAAPTPHSREKTKTGANIHAEDEERIRDAAAVVTAVAAGCGYHHSGRLAAEAKAVLVP